MLLNLFVVVFKVKPIKLSKAGIPLGVLSQGGSSKSAKPSEDMEAEETQTHIPRNTTRNRDETKEEKKQRKQEVKSDRKVCLFQLRFGTCYLDHHAILCRVMPALQTKNILANFVIDSV